MYLIFQKLESRSKKIINFRPTWISNKFKTSLDFTIRAEKKS